MGQYYQCSLLTIAVTGTSSKHGFLSPRPKRPFKSLARLPYREENEAQHGFFYVYKDDTHVDEKFLSGVWDSDLLKRGWVFQEWILSRRIVYFTPSQIFFECQTKPPKSECQEPVGLRRLPIDLNKGFRLKSTI